MATSTEPDCGYSRVPIFSCSNSDATQQLAEAIRRGVKRNWYQILVRLRANDVLDYLTATEYFRPSDNWEDFKRIRSQTTETARAQELLKAVLDRGDGAIVALLQAAREAHGDDEEGISTLLVAEVAEDAVHSFRNYWPTTRSLSLSESRAEQAVIQHLHTALVQLHENSLCLSCDYGYLPEDAPLDYYVDTDILEMKKEEALRTMEMAQKQRSVTGGREVWVNATSKVLHLGDLPFAEGRLRSLVIGAPGVGKSRLCLEFLRQWSRGQKWKKIRFPFLLPARELKRTVATCRFSASDANWLGFLCLSELTVGGLDKEEQKLAWKYLRSHSEEVVIFLDGLDELDTDLLDSRNSYLHQLIHRHVLPSCSLFITSRPCEKALELVHWTNKHYQIKGMSAKQLRELMTKWLGSEKATCALEKQLDERPQLKNAVSVPLVATMVLHIAHAGRKNDLPHSLGECYKMIVIGLLRHYAKRSLTEELGVFPKVDDLDPGKCPTSIRRVLIGLEDIALDLLVSHKRVVSLSEMKKISGGLTVLDSGLLVQSHKHSNNTQHETSSEFIHSTFQEYLAARAVCRHMSRAHAENCIQTCLKTIGTDLNMQMFWLFLASMLRVELLVKLLQALHRSVQSSAFLQRKYVTILILHCLAQRAHDMVGHKELSVANILAPKSKSLDLSNYELTDGDFTALVTVLDSATGLTEIHLVDCCLYPSRCKELVKCRGFRQAAVLDLGANPLLRGESLKCLSDGIADIGEGMSTTSLSFRSCWLTENDAPSVCTLVNSLRLLTELTLNSNKFDDAGTRGLSAALRGCRALEVLYLERCNLRSNGAAEVAKVFSCMRSLKMTSLSMNPLGNQGARFVLEGLAGNKRLQGVSLNLTDMDDASCGFLEDFVRWQAVRGSDLSDDKLSLCLTGNALSQHTRHKLQETLANCATVCHVTVDFGYCTIDADGNHELDSSMLLNGKVLYYSRYSERYISNQGLGELPAERLASIVSSLNDVDCLCLERNGIRDDVLQGINSAMAQNSRTLALDLSFNAITCNGMFSLATALSLYNKTLRYLNFQDNKLFGTQGDCAATATVVSKSLELLLQHCPNLHFLGLSVTGVGDAEVINLSHHLLPSSPLRFLALSRNNITDNSMAELSCCLKKNKALRVLLLHGNCITGAGVPFLDELQRTRDAGPLDIITLIGVPAARGLPGLVEAPLLFCYSTEILDMLDSLT